MENLPWINNEIKLLEDLKTKVHCKAIPTQRLITHALYRDETHAQFGKNSVFAENLVNP